MKGEISMITKIINDLGFTDLICTSFEEAQKNNRRKNIVVIENSDVYLTYKFEGVFGEFISWTEEEFQRDESVYNSLAEWVKFIYSKSDEEIHELIKGPESRFSKVIKGFYFKNY